jgi:hypothetical protein
MLAKADQAFCCMLCRTSRGKKHGVKCERIAFPLVPSKPSQVEQLKKRKNVVKKSLINKSCVEPSLSHFEPKPQLRRDTKAKEGSPKKERVKTAESSQTTELLQGKTTHSQKQLTSSLLIDQCGDDELYPPAPPPVRAVPILVNSAPPPVRFPKKKKGQGAH